MDPDWENPDGAHIGAIIFGGCRGSLSECRARETPKGWMPYPGDVEWNGLDFPELGFNELQAFDRSVWQAEVMSHGERFIDLHARLPKEKICEREPLICRM